LINAWIFDHINDFECSTIMYNYQTHEQLNK